MVFNVLNIIVYLLTHTMCLMLAILITKASITMIIVRCYYNIPKGRHYYSTASKPLPYFCSKSPYHFDYLMENHNSKVKRSYLSISSMLVITIFLLLFFDNVQEFINGPGVLALDFSKPNRLIDPTNRIHIWFHLFGYKHCDKLHS